MEDTSPEATMATIIAAATNATAEEAATSAPMAPTMQPQVVVGATRIHTYIDPATVATKETVGKTLATMQAEGMEKRQKEASQKEVEHETVATATQQANAPATTAQACKTPNPKTKK